MVENGTSVIVKNAATNLFSSSAFFIARLGSTFKLTFVNKILNSNFKAIYIQNVKYMYRMSHITIKTRFYSGGRQSVMLKRGQPQLNS